jgi:hypothetical protein
MWPCDPVRLICVRVSDCKLQSKLQQDAKITFGAVVDPSERLKLIE